MQVLSDAEAKMIHVRAVVLRAAYHLQRFYRYLTPGARRSQRETYQRATAHLKRSFVG
jgi:hypothetical protein